MASLRLTRPIRPKGHAPLHTVNEACAYIISLPGRVATMQPWESAAGLALQSRDDPSPAVLVELTAQVELALFLTHRLDLTADRSSFDRVFDRARSARVPP